MKTLKFFAAILASCFTLFNSGCFYLTGEKTYWEKEFEDAGYDGPGEVDIVAKNYQDVKYRGNDGNCISIGILPGYAQMYHEQKYCPVWREIVYAIFVPLANGLCVGWPTFDALFFQPFGYQYKDKNLQGVSEFGLIGVHRWKEEAEYRARIETKIIEHVVTGNNQDKSDLRAPFATSRDGTKVYFSYPGFSNIKSDVQRTGKADVLHDDGLCIRRFKPAKKADGYLIFEDRTLADENILKKHIAFRATCKQLKAKAAAASTSVADNERKRRIQKLIGEIDEKLGENLVDDYTFRKLNDDWVRRVSENLDELVSSGQDGAKRGSRSCPKDTHKTIKSEFEL